MISSYVDNHVSSVVAPFPDCDFIAFIPNYELKTSDSRNVLPQELSYKEAVIASSIANVAIAGLLRGDLTLAGQAVQGDRFHEKYRQSLVKEVDPIKEIAQSNGAYATYLSGAGPTVMTLAPKDKSQVIKEKIDALKLDGESFILSADTKGVFVD